MYILLLISTLAISGLATLYVKGMISKYSRVPASSGYSGAQTAQRILQARGIHDVIILESDGMMGDHYNPLNKQLVLSDRCLPGHVHGGGRASPRTSAATPSSIRKRYATAATAVDRPSGATQFSSQIVMVRAHDSVPVHCTSFRPSHRADDRWPSRLGIIMAFNLVTLPVEYDASRRAKAILPETGHHSRPGRVAGGRQGPRRGGADVPRGVPDLAGLLPVLSAAVVGWWQQSALSRAQTSVAGWPGCVYPAFPFSEGRVSLFSTASSLCPSKIPSTTRNAWRRS